MSLPISTVGAVVGAAKVAREISQGLAQGITQGVSGAIGFDDVLNQAGPAEPAELTSELIGAIEQRLSDAGINVNQDLSIRITASGQLQFDGDHAQAAEIESILNSDPQITGIANRLAGTDQAQTLQTSGLTIPGGQGNIRNSSGGYPNW